VFPKRDEVEKRKKKAERIKRKKTGNKNNIVPKYCKRLKLLSKTDYCICLIKRTRKEQERNKKQIKKQIKKQESKRGRERRRLGTSLDGT
jgi:hypothetical protein